MKAGIKTPLITVGVAHFRDVDFVLNSLHCLRQLTRNPYKVLIRDNNSGRRCLRRLETGAKKYDNVYIYSAGKDFNLRGGLAHGTALNDLVSRIETPYGAILDADCTWLIKGWDRILLDRLDEQVKIIGTQTTLEERQDFPFIYGVLFETEVMKDLNIDFRPRKEPYVRDTAWEMKEKYIKAGYRGVVIPIKNTRTYKKGPFRDVICTEFYLEGFNHIFASHFGRGSTLGSAKYQKGASLASFLYRLPVLGRLPRQWKGQSERKKWIKICRNIADSQI